jgi:small nuclear ribonucleoprotein (snRNP)-like protein
MRRKVRTVIVFSLLLSLICYAPSRASAQGKEAKLAAQVKTAIAKIGTGTDARVEVKLRDKTKLKGYVGGADEAGFLVVNDKTGVATQIAYPQVKQMKGHNFLSGEKIALGLILFIVIMSVIQGVMEGSPP